MIVAGLWILALHVFVAAVSWVSFRAGYRAALELEVQDEQPICGCGHHRAFHEGVARCRAPARRGISPTCTCQNYIGPEPMPKFLIPHMTESKGK